MLCSFQASRPYSLPAKKMDKEKYILLTIDVEDWFQVENFRPWIPFETWDQRELRVEKNIHRLLDLFDSVKLKAQSSELKADNQVKNNYELSAMNYELGRRPKATFFVLGWFAERLPNLVREIHSRGHEVASHGYSHNLCNQQSHADLKQELTDSKKILEDIIGASILGFRAPNFSINKDILKIIEDCDYLYDSSYNSFGLNGRYGQVSLNGHFKKGIAHKISEHFFELPISNLNLRSPMSYLLPTPNSRQNDGNRFVLPWGGGGYFRLIPYRFFKYGVQSILRRDGVYMFYMHPWEIDTDQPRVKEANLQYKFRHYMNLKHASSKLMRLIRAFKYCDFVTCSDYLDRRQLDGV
jgi:polysaccharide deacetylase family protein (PEP-CTERM system associated)